MTEQDFDAEIIRIESEAKIQKNELYLKYAESNRTNNVGDVITDGSSTIEIKKHVVRFTGLSRYPDIVYSGIKLKKDLTPYKNGDWDTIWQSNIKN